MSVNVSKLDEWVGRCCTQDIEVHRLEYVTEGTGLYMTKKKIGNGVPCYGWTTPVYHVWINDRNEVSTCNYQEAYYIYNKRKGDITND